MGIMELNIFHSQACRNELLYICGQIKIQVHMFDIMSMMNKVKEAQAKIKAAQQELIYLRAEGEAGAGLVKVIVNGERKVIDMIIDDSLVNMEDKEMLKDLIVAASNFAFQAIEVKIKEKMKNATEGIMPSIPGMDFGNMF